MKQDWDHWFEGKVFTTSWTTLHLPVWFEMLADRRERALDILEIGSWEGRSAICFLEHLPKARLTCVDTFEGGEEHQARGAAMSEVENRFDQNLAKYAGRVEKIRSRSLPALDRLNEAKRHFDIIYIDGSHQREDVMLDSALSWKMLKEGGLLFWDDYLWGKERPAAKRPMAAVDAFLKMVEGEFHLRATGRQVVAEKTAPSANFRLKPATVNAPMRNVRNLIKFLKREPFA